MPRLRCKRCKNNSIEISEEQLRWMRDHLLPCRIEELFNVEG